MSLWSEYSASRVPGPRRVPVGTVLLLVVVGGLVIHWLARDEPTYEQYMRRGEQAAAIGRFSVAVAAFTHAIRRDPGSAEAYRRRASAHMNVAGFESALRDLDIALRLDPRYPQALYDRAITKYQLGMGQSEVCRDLEPACALGKPWACEQVRKAECAVPEEPPAAPAMSDRG